MTVKELKDTLNNIENENLEVRVEIQEDGMGTAYPLALVHYDYGKIYLLGGDHKNINEFEVGFIIKQK